MKPFTKIFLILTISILICQLTYFVSQKGSKTYNVHKNTRLYEILEASTYYDILFLGSSRTHTGVYPLIIDTFTGKNSYNAGVEGGNIFEFKMILEAYLQTHPKPELLVLNLDPGSLDIRRKFYNPVQYFPFIENKVICKYLRERDYHVELFKLFPFLELTHYDDYTRVNCMKGFRGETEIPAGDFQYKGFLSNSLKSVSSESLSRQDTSAVVCSEEGIKMFRDMLEFCKKRQIKLILTYAPEFKRTLQSRIKNFPEVTALFDKIAKEYRVPYLRHDFLNLCEFKKNFANPGHLNAYGALEYSKFLGQELKKYLK